MQGCQRLSLAVLVLPWLAVATGCSTRVTNLTPSVLPREASGLYHFESEWTSTQRSLELRSADIKGYVVVDHKFYPMERVPQMTNRWEAEVPLTNNPVYYLFKWNYETAAMGRGRSNPNSFRSQEYRLEIVENLKPTTPPR